MNTNESFRKEMECTINNLNKEELIDYIESVMKAIYLEGKID